MNIEEPLGSSAETSNLKTLSNTKYEQGSATMSPPESLASLERADLV